MLFACAATAGFGGGNCASSMANISFFYPEREKGYALGLNAAGGNLGVATAQLVVPLVIIIGVPAAMDSLTHAKADTRSYVASLRNRQTWIISLLYIGTFGSFIGFSFALPLVIKNTFPDFVAGHPFIATYLGGLGFIGALVGSLARPVGGRLADRIGGARVTLAVFIGMALFTAAAITGVDHRSFGLFFASYMVIFLLAGMGNGSTYKMIPSIFAALGRADAESNGLARRRWSTSDGRLRSSVSPVRSEPSAASSSRLPSARPASTSPPW